MPAMGEMMHMGVANTGSNTADAELSFHLAPMGGGGWP
jgi:hypothetical protein